MSDSEDCNSYRILSSSSSSYCLCEENEEESICESDSSSETSLESTAQIQTYREAEGFEKQEDGAAEGSNELSESSMTTVTDDTSASELNIVCSISSKGTAIRYFIPEKYTRTKIRKFRKPIYRQFVVEASSAINRRKKQYQIDRENMMILKRLREVKPVVILPK